MMRLCRMALVAAFSIFAVVPSRAAAETGDVLRQIEQLVVQGEKAPASLGESVRDAAEADPMGVSAVLLAKLKAGGLSDEQKVVYSWALGLTRQPASMDVLADIYAKSKSARVRNNCLRAISMTGNKKAGEFLLKVLDGERDDEARFEILNLLGEMQYEPALARMVEVLKKSPEEYYWQSVFVLGKMGDKAVPFLIERIADKDPNVRANAIAVVGQWHMAPEAAAPLEERYWVESDKDMRGAILASLERTITDLSAMAAFFQEVVGKEKDEELRTFARETLANMDLIKAAVAEFVQERNSSPAAFKAALTELDKSAGKKGDYVALAKSSGPGDEPSLKALRERILQRDSDEAFADYQAVNNIILFSRLAAGSRMSLESTSSAGAK